MLTYFRTGQYYLSRGGPYAEFYPEVLRLSEGHYWVDYGYHLAPIQASHLGEMEALAVDHGVPSFKIFMFYGDYGLHGKADRGAQRGFLMLGEDERYDLAHFEFVLRGAAAVRERHPRLADHVSVSLHCEIADILNAYTRVVQQDPSLTGLRAYSAARPPHSEGLGVWIASYLAHEAACRNVNLLHLSSRKALEAALLMRATLPHLDLRCEVTAGHLLLDYDTPAGPHAKVNPPIRSREDVEFLWRGVLEGKVDWVVSDHACCATETKLDRSRPDDVWLAKAGFGGTEYLLPGVFSEGTRRGLPPGRVAESSPGTRRGAWDRGQGRHRAGLRRRPGPPRSRPVRHGTGGRLAVGPGVHALRGPHAPGSGDDDDPPRSGRLRSREGCRVPARALPPASDAGTLSARGRIPQLEPTVGKRTRDE